MLTHTQPDTMADAVWLWQPHNQLMQSPRQGVGVALRLWEDMTDDRLHCLAEALADLPQVGTHGVNLIECQAGMDIIPLARLEGHLKTKGITCRWFSAAHALEGIAQSEALLAMRFHAVLVGALLGVPMVSLSYDPKVQTLAASLKIPDIPAPQWSHITAAQIQAVLANPLAIASLQQSAHEGCTQLRSWLNRHQQSCSS
jgi:polysaccharide pyruvyl transferase WcaK-like protein